VKKLNSQDLNIKNIVLQMSEQV